jgi:exportin-1
VGRNQEIAQPFYVAYLKLLIEDIFVVMTDRLHKSGFKSHATLLRHMFHIIETGQVGTMNAPGG